MIEMLKEILLHIMHYMFPLKYVIFFGFFVILTDSLFYLQPRNRGDVRPSSVISLDFIEEGIDNLDDLGAFLDFLQIKSISFNIIL